jgi:hypothetical protein
VRGRTLRLALRDFESRYGPTLLILDNRPVAIVPIRRPYADDLLRTSQQRHLLPLPEAAIRNERLYLSSPRTLRVLVPGSVLMFYESVGRERGRGAVIACARVVRNALREAATVSPELARRGVLTTQEIAGLSTTGTTALIYFDQLMRLTRPVCLGRLRDLGCVDRANLVTARRIPTSAALSILEEGKPSVTL